MARKIIQIQTVFHRSFGESHFYIYALCDDGTLWVRAPYASNTNWTKIEAIPDA